MRPGSQLVGTGNPSLRPGAGCMAPTELSRTKWLRVTLQSQTDGRHHQDYKRRTDSAKSSLQLSWKHHFLFNRCPRKPQTHHKLLHPQHPTGFLQSPVASSFMLPSPFGVQVPAENSQWVSSVRWLRGARLVPAVSSWVWEEGEEDLFLYSISFLALKKRRR